jgi:molybdate transport system substrate-binding protein
MSRLVAALCVWLAAASQTQVVAAGQLPLTVFAAASLTEVVEAAAGEFTARGGPPVVVVAGASSAMARQIEAGAPADIFASAHRQWVEYLNERDLLVVGSLIRPAGTDLVLVAQSDGGVVPGGDFVGQLLALLGDSGRLAVGDPAHVPAGLYAKQALQTAGLWSQLEPRLARAENVRAALALVSRGEAAAGLVYRTDVQLTRLDWVRTVPRELVAAVQYDFVALQRKVSHPAAASFLDFLTSEGGRAIFIRYGFDVTLGD